MAKTEAEKQLENEQWDDYRALMFDAWEKREKEGQTDLWKMVAKLFGEEKVPK